MNRAFWVRVAVVLPLFLALSGCRFFSFGHDARTGGDAGTDGTGSLISGPGTGPGTDTSLVPPPTIPDGKNGPGTDTGPRSLSQSMSEGDLLSKFNQIRDPKYLPVYFAFNQSFIGSAEVPKITAIAEYLTKTPAHQLLIEGNCDERGSEEYNRGLGERRALAVKEALTKLGIDAARLHTISYGEERPADPGHTESAFAKNRRAEFVFLVPKQ